jgi:hypothetical protein
LLLLDGRQRVVEVRGLQVAMAVAVAAVGRTGQALLRLEWLLLLLLLRVCVAKAECRVLHVVAHQHVRRRTEPERKPGTALVLLRLVHMLLVLEVVVEMAATHQATRGIRRHVVVLVRLLLLVLVLWVLVLLVMMLVELVLLKLVRVLVGLHVMRHLVRRTYARQWRQVEAAGIGRHQRRRRSHAEHATAGHRCGLSAVQSQRVARVVAVVPQLVVARNRRKGKRGGGGVRKQT